MWKKFRNFHHVDCKIFVFEVTKIFWGGLAKNQVAALHKVTFDEKMFMLVVLLWIHSSSQVGYMLENFEIIWNRTTNRKEIVSRKK